MYHLQISGVKHGPFSPGQVREMLEAGQINGDTLYWQEGLTECLPLSEIAEELRSPATGSHSLYAGKYAHLLAPKKKSNPPNFGIVLVGTIIFLPIGPIAGIIWLCDPAKRYAGAAMLAISIVVGILEGMVLRMIA